MRKRILRSSEKEGIIERDTKKNETRNRAAVRSVWV